MQLSPNNLGFNPEQLSQFFSNSDNNDNNLQSLSQFLQVDSNNLGFNQQQLSNLFQTKPLRLDVPASVIVDETLQELQVKGPQIVENLRKIQNNRLLVSLYSQNNDPCSVIPDDLANTVNSMFTTVQRSRQNFIDIIDAVQQIKKNEKNIEVILRESSRALRATKPIVASFDNLFNTNEQCRNNVQATIGGFDSIGNVLETLGATNLVATDGEVKRLLLKGGEATKILGNVARSLEADGFTSLCPDSPTFNADVFQGVSTALMGFKDVAATFGADSELFDLDRTVETIREGAVSIFL